MIYGDFGTSTNFSIGVYVDYIFPRMHQRLSFHNSLLITAYKFKGTYSEVENELYYTNYKIDFGCSQIKLLSSMKYRYPVGKLFIHGKVGISGALMVSSINTVDINLTFYDIYRSRTTPAILGTRGSELGLFGGFGMSYKKFSLEAVYEYSDGISDLNQFNSDVSRIYILLGFSLK